MQTDASGSWGAGVFWKSEWFQIKCPVALQGTNCNKGNTIAHVLWGPQWAGSTIWVHHDNDAMVAIINSGYSRDQVMMHLLRCIFSFFAAKCDFTLTVVHISGYYNTLVDALSRECTSFLIISPTGQFTSYSSTSGHDRNNTDRKVRLDIQWLNALVSFYLHTSLAPSTTRS